MDIGFTSMLCNSISLVASVYDGDVQVYHMQPQKECIVGFTRRLYKFFYLTSLVYIEDGVWATSFRGEADKSGCLIICPTHV